MCIICVSGKGARQPDEGEIRTMFRRNPHGAGYMVAEGGHVRIEKGFMNVTDLLRSLRWEKFTRDDVVVYHFRISTQAGVNPEMTQPFPFASEKNIEAMKYLTLTTACGIAHNGIITATSDPFETEYSDTALFIARYLPHIMKTNFDLHDPEKLDEVQRIIHSRMVFLDGDGEIGMTGDFIEHDGMYFSNHSFEEVPRDLFTFADVKRKRGKAI